MKKYLPLLAISAVSAFTFTSCDSDSSSSRSTALSERQVTVTFEAVGPLAFAPVLLTAHDGSVDYFDTGSAASAELESMAEVGDISGLQALTDDIFSSAASAAPTAPTGTFTVTLTISEANRYFSYAGMILPSSDTFVGNNNPTQFDVSELLDANNNTPIVINIDRLYDAGTEVNDFLTAPGGPLVGAPVGVPGNGVDENAVITLATGNHFDNYLNAGGFDVNTINPNGQVVGRITIEPVQ